MQSLLALSLYIMCQTVEESENEAVFGLPPCMHPRLYTHTHTHTCTHPHAHIHTHTPHTTLYPSLFLLQDFGAYAERPYTVKTSEGEAMKQLLDGYIDLILQTVSNCIGEREG